MDIGQLEQLSHNKNVYIQMNKNIRSVIHLLINNSRYQVQTFIQNQYNFFVDFKGLLYFDDSTPFIYPNCIKDIKFINQLYKNLKKNPNPNHNQQNKVYEHYAEFWGQRNYVRSAISPVIFNGIENDGKLCFSINQKTQFIPEQLTVDSEGRIWHPFRDDIRGVFSNDLMVTLMDKVKYQGEKVLLNYEDKYHEISKQQK